ncbi:hypothetical protein M2360_004700 [Rhizobium sp. SG_E_25_P2]|uniref:methionyl-tRNA formyltransferase n=1 Tax=Rhizobium sp. SG_E_25_P2 TaxID=2879942 RepID=UPI002473B743|nr:methionyl-tRNA formyltransferase [Rhizobium sp. SG_E_25_P2]MDH6269273.1 hypothetical protein [Rhizobium sp. SG_E_25_P2]
MALVRDFKRKEMGRNSLHKEIDATFSVFGDGDAKVLQIDTYGSETREMPGKKSQSIQLDRLGAERLLKILRTEFSL